MNFIDWIALTWKLDDVEVYKIFIHCTGKLKRYLGAVNHVENTIYFQFWNFQDVLDFFVCKILCNELSSFIITKLVSRRKRNVKTNSMFSWSKKGRDRIDRSILCESSDNYDRRIKQIIWQLINGKFLEATVVNNYNIHSSCW